ncbi:MAG: LCP family protein [Bacilli bacterium]|nr:LCP family protein [Bacilli bacterium]
MKKKENKKPTKDKNKRSKKVVSRIINILSIIVLGVFLYYMYKSDLFPIKYFRIAAITLIALEIIYTLLCINKKRSGVILKIFNVFAILFILVEAAAFYYVYRTITFLDTNLGKNYEFDEYYVIANVSSEIKDIKEADGGEIFYYVDTEHYNELKATLKKKTTAKIAKTDTLDESLMKLSYPENLVILNAGTYQSITTNDETYASYLKIVDTIKFRIKKEKAKTPDIDITNTPFTIFLSGIDTRGGSLVKRSLSDVNMVIVVNPNTRTILLVSIPRDSYVQLHGTTGRKDKLTHAGSLGGVELSKATVEDMLDIKTDYYVRANFQAVMNLVDAVGGVTVYEDATDRRFSCWTDRRCWIEPGENNLNGQCALAFARERYEYWDGDMQRNRNQQKVLKAIVDKMTSSTTLIVNYSSILKSLDGTFETSMSTEEITSLVKFQINDMRGWTFKSQNITGGTGREQTYSGGSTPLSVVYPSQKTINEAKDAIAKVLAGESLDEEETTEE